MQIRDLMLPPTPTPTGIVLNNKYCSESQELRNKSINHFLVHAKSRAVVRGKALHTAQLEYTVHTAAPKCPKCTSVNCAEPNSRVSNIECFASKLKTGDC